jgi:putative ATP-dependent endonuclease of OLD family
VWLTRGNILFSRFGILVEEETDAFLCEELARLLGLDLFASGVCCVEYSVIGVDKLIRLSFSILPQLCCVKERPISAV